MRAKVIRDETNSCLMSEAFYLNTMFQDSTDYVKTVHGERLQRVVIQIPKTKPGLTITKYLLDLFCIDFTKLDPSKDSKENFLVLTDTFTKFHKAFIMSNQKAITVAKILVDKGFYVYGIPACIHSNKGWCFDN